MDTDPRNNTMNKHTNRLMREVVLLHTIFRTALQNCQDEKKECQGVYLYKTKTDLNEKGKSDLNDGKSKSLDTVLNTRWQ